MPPQVDFYLTNAADPEAMPILVCRIVEKGVRQGRRFHLLVASPLWARYLDQLLWTFRPGSFVPHALLREARQPLPPVLIEIPPLTRAQGDVLVNLTGAPPPTTEGFRRIIEIADGNPATRDQARQRFKWYKAQGLEPATHQL